MEPDSRRNSNIAADHGPAQQPLNAPLSDGFFVSPPSLSLPRGGGAIRGIGEKFTANPSNGTATMSVPIMTSPGRDGFGPQLSLSYDSGAGNGPVGVGWNMHTPAIVRKTDKGVPTYLDMPPAHGRDVFMLTGDDDLVAVLAPDGSRHEDTASAPDYLIHRYRPRIEVGFARIERWTRTGDAADVHWRSMSKDNVLTIYGHDANSRIVDPAEPQRIFSWLVSEVRDDKGNVVVHQYKPEDAIGIDLTRAHQANRGPATALRRAVQRYPKRILYGNRTPLLDAAGQRPQTLTAPQRAAAQWMFEVVFDYGEHDANAPTPNDAGDWLARRDAFSTYRAGFEIRSDRLCRRVLMFHHFPAEAGIGNDCLVRATTLHYREQPVGAFLDALTQSACRRDGVGGYVHKSMPTLELSYSEAIVGDTVAELDADSVENLPAGVGDGAYRWVDLDGEGLTGLLTERGGGWFYKRNESPLNRTPPAVAWKARFAPLEAVARVPGTMSLDDPHCQFIDLAGDGCVDLVDFRPPLSGFYERSDARDWAPFRAFGSVPNLPWDDPDLFFIDLTGDGHADILLAEDEVITWHPSLGEKGFGQARRAQSPPDEERGPRFVAADRTQSIFLADFSGDGLTDVVRIRNGEVCYWPNLGHGRFGSKVAMDGSPRFETEGEFDPRRLRLIDIDGSGVTDLIYLGARETRFWFNECGNAWSAAQALPGFQPVDDIAAVSATDLLGNGTACLVWSSSLPDTTRSPMKYLNLMSEGKPHLLIGSRNNLGAETRIRYAPSTYFYLRDRRAGEPWITNLPFPVHVVERVETIDHVSRNRFVARYAYHHGHFDGHEREFRGFGRVDQWDTEDMAALSSGGVPAATSSLDMASAVPPILTRTWYHTGIHLGRDHVSDFFAGLLDAGDLGEYYREPGVSDSQARASRLADSELPSGLSADEEREAARSLKGSVLRQEVYAVDGGAKQAHPYAVSEHNFTVRMLQGRGDNPHAVFFVHPSESLTRHHEREPDDPRIAHALTLEVDVFGNVLKTAAVAYGRRVPDAVALPLPADQDRQARSFVTCAESEVTNGLDTAPDHRAPVVCETRGYELTGYAPTGTGGRFRHADFVKPGAAVPPRMVPVFDGEIAHEATPGGGRERRLLSHARSLFRPDDFGQAAGDIEALLPLGQLGRLAMAGESYRLAFTPGLLQQTYQRAGVSLLPAKPGDVMRGAAIDHGGYVASEDLKARGSFPASDANGHWWAPSGRTFLSPNDGDTAAQERAHAAAHFFTGLRFRDPFLHTTTLSVDGHDLLPVEVVDPLGNRTTVGERLKGGGIDAAQPGNDYRVLQAWRVMDPNRNRVQVGFDILGMVVGTAVMGKPEEVAGDSLAGFVADLSEAVALAHLAHPLAAPQALLGRASTRVVYDLFAYQRTKDDAQPQPTVACTLSRETHDSDPAPPGGLKFQHGFAYSDGFGRVIQTKARARPGPAPERDAFGAIVIDAGGLPKLSIGDVDPRWVGSGWTVFNDKGKPVRQFEPFFTDTQAFDFDVRIGSGVFLFYDPLERTVATLHPDHTWSKVSFDPWRQEIWDASDTVSLADPAADPDVGDHFSRLPAGNYLPTWHAQRQGGALGLEAQTCAAKALLLAESPTVVHADALGRAFLTEARNKAKYSDTAAAAPPVETVHRSRVSLDIAGQTRSVTDTADRVVMRYDFDMLGQRTHRSGMESGQGWVLVDVAGRPMLTWDTRDQRLRTRYDAKGRPVALFLQDGGGAEAMIGRTVHGESLAAAEALNLRGKVAEAFDQAGVARTGECDFKGNALSGERQFAQSYKSVLDWSAPVALEADVHVGRSRFDALDRKVMVIAPHRLAVGTDINVLQPAFDEAGQLAAIDVWLGLAAEPAGLLAPASATLHAVTRVERAADGQRTRIDHGNGATTTYAYDPLTSRLVQLLTKRDAAAFAQDCPQPAPTGWPGCRIQNLHYTYDAVGNTAAIRDDAQQTIYFRNVRVEPSAAYTYDALSRLIEATGREQLGPAGGPSAHSYDDAGRTGLPHRGDGNATGRYLERYRYDLDGNFEAISHVGTDPAHPGWTRSYAYEEPSQLQPALKSNRLTRTQVGAVTETCSTAGDGYDASGNMLRLPQLQELRWDAQGRLRMTQRQAVGALDADGLARHGERTWYVYDASGQRVRKVTELATGAVKDERSYLDGFELYRRHGANALVRETLHVMDDRHRIAIVETRTAGQDASPRQLIRYQFGNRLGSASLELDVSAQIISYEEYTPYGSTSYQAVRSQTETPKRYRHAGKERDDESGLCYHAARYRAPWLGRWTSCDPAGIEAGLDLYCYCRNNPVGLIDPDGRTPYDPHQDRLLGRFEKWLLYENDSPIRDAITNDKNLQDVQVGIAVVTVSTVVALGTGGASLALGATAIEAGVIGGGAGGMASAYYGAGIQGRLPTTKEAVTDTLTGAAFGGGAAAIESKVLPAIVNKLVPKPNFGPAATPRATLPPAEPGPPAAPAAGVAPDAQLSLFPGEPAAAATPPAAAPPPPPLEIPYQIDLGEVKSTNWTVDKTINYQGKFVFQEGLDVTPGRIQGALRYTPDAKVIVDLRELGGMEGKVGQTYILDLDPALVAKETAGMQFGDSAYGNKMEVIVNQRVGAATGQVPVYRPPEQGGADFIPTQLRFPLMGWF